MYEGQPVLIKNDERKHSHVVLSVDNDGLPMLEMNDASETSRLRATVGPDGSGSYYTVDQRGWSKKLYFPKGKGGPTQIAVPAGFLSDLK